MRRGETTRRARAAIVAIVAGAGLAGCGPAQPPPVDRLVLVTIDTLRADRVGSYGDTKAHTPVLDSLAQTGIRFATAISPAPITMPSHSSIFTGLDPPAHGVRTNGIYELSPDVPIATERLRDGGYATAAFVGAAVLDARFGLARGFDHYDDDVGDRTAAGVFSFAERTANVVVDAALAWVREAPDRFFLWVHLYDPHANYRPPPEYARLVPDDPYAGEIAFADAQVGRLLSGIERRFGGDSLAVIVTSDHGESLGEHGESTHTLTIHDATQHVPLLLRAPGLPRGGVVRAPVLSIDVGPTLLDLAGLEPLPGARGRSVLGLARGESDEPRIAYLEAIEPQITLGWSPALGVRTATHKYIRVPRPELYDLAADPRELHDIAAAEPERAEGLDAALEALLVEARAHAPAEPAAPRALSREERERLESLGYVIPEADGLDAMAIGVVGGLDPKDHMHEAKSIELARQLVDDGLGKRALAVLAGVQSRGDQVRRMRAEAAILAGRFDLLAEIGRARVAERPGNGDGHYLVGTAQLGLGEIDAAETTFETLISVAPEQSGGPLGLASVARARGDREAERRWLEQADALESAPGPARLRLAILTFDEGDLAAAREILATLPASFLERGANPAHVARAEHAAGDSAGALARLARAERKHPDSRPILRARATILEETRQTAKAAATWRRIFALDPNDPRSKNDLAWGLATHGTNLDEALALALEASVALDHSPASLDTLATVHLARGEAAAALEAADRALATARAALRPHLLYVRAAALSDLGRTREARAALAALDAEPTPLAPPWRGRVEALEEHLGS